MITVLDCVRFSENVPSNYKLVKIEEAIPDEPCTTTSRYEVIEQKLRRMYFDLDGIPAVMADEIIDSFIDDMIKFMLKRHIMTKNTILRRTENRHSVTHPGVGFHVLASDLAMHYMDNKRFAIEFCREYDRYSKYLDLSIYSKKQLFKVPNFIGIPLINTDNYHKPFGKKEHYPELLVQNINHCNYVELPRVEESESVKLELGPCDPGYISYLREEACPYERRNLHESPVQVTDKKIRDTMAAIERMLNNSDKLWEEKLRVYKKVLPTTDKPDLIIKSVRHIFQLIYGKNAEYP